MIAALEAAICTALGEVPGVAVARPYAGELEDHARATLAVPAVLVMLTGLTVEPDPGTGEVLTRASWSALIFSRQAQAAERRGADAWALAEGVLAAVRMQTWALPGVSPAVLQDVRPIWRFEDRALACREVRWSHLVRIGEPEALGPTVRPEQVWLGQAPKIGAAHVDDYWRVWPVPDPPTPRPPLGRRLLPDPSTLPPAAILMAYDGAWYVQIEGGVAPVEAFAAWGLLPDPSALPDGATLQVDEADWWVETAPGDWVRVVTLPRTAELPDPAGLVDGALLTTIAGQWGVAL